MALSSYAIKSLPGGEDYQSMANSFLGSSLLLLNDFSKSKSSIITDDPELCARIGSCVSGFDCVADNLPRIDNPEALVIFSPQSESDEKVAKEDLVPLFSELHNLMAGKNARLYLSLVKADQSHIRLVAERVEEALSSREVRLTTSSGGKGSSAQSLQSELFYGSDERRMLISMLGMIGEISALNGSAYKVVLIVDGEKEIMLDYLKSKVHILGSIRLKCTSVKDLYNAVKTIDAIPFSYHSASRFLSFSQSIPRRSRIATQQVLGSERGIGIGTFLKDSLSESASEIKIEKSTLNLGTILTGLPGTGKTFAAMSLLSKLNKSGEQRNSTVVIAPTKEWGEFARSQNLPLIKIYGSGIPINFFRCANEGLKEKFSENLAMLISCASSAGPYQSSMEKCLLAAFRRVYSKNLCPDPVELYEQIEETIIEQHAKRSNTGVKYTKHGENIRAALQNLRLMLFRPEFAATIGIDLNEIFANGAVFDLSDVSGNMRPLFYALLLNQLYSFLDRFDEMGNEQLRIAIALEEAQLMFSAQEDSPAVVDLKQRIQDFRKKGIGLMLITHSVTDITPSIRRMCQTKFYFRQSADVAKYALLDLGLDAADQDSLARIRGLEQGSCALLYLENEVGQKLPRGPVFMKVNGEINKNTSVRIGNNLTISSSNLACDSTFKLIDIVGNPIQNQTVELSYIGEKIAEGTTNDSGEVIFRNLIADKKYKMIVIGKTKKDTQSYSLIAARKIELILKQK